MSTLAFTTLQVPLFLPPMEITRPQQLSGTTALGRRYPNLLSQIKVFDQAPVTNNSTFNVIIKNSLRSVWNDTPNVNRTSANAFSYLTVTVIDGS